MIFRTSTTFLCFPFAALMLLQGSSCQSGGGQKNSAGMTKPVPSNPSKPSPAPVTPSPASRALAPGVWGGQHISLDVTPGGAEIDYDCARGSITEKIVPDAAGQFVVKGRLVKEHGGPVRADEDQTGQPATYRGTLDGDTMTLTVTLSGNNETVGTYTLTRGKAGRVMKCL